MIDRVLVPRLNANEDSLLVVSIETTVGSRVQAGDIVFVVESSKATVEVEATSDGYVRKIVAETDQMLDVGTPVLLITDTPDEPIPDEAHSPAESPESGGPEEPKRKTAKDRLREKGKAGAAAASSNRAKPGRQVVSQIQDSGEIPWVMDIRKTMDSLGDSAAESIEQTLEGPVTGPLSADGIEIAAGATVAPGATIVARRLFIGPNASVGAGTVLRADAIYLGSEVKVGKGVSLHSGEILIEDGALLAENITGDLSGGRTAQSRLIVGAASLVGAGAFLNTAREILLERECAVSPGAMLFTHSFWQSALEGYHPSFESIRVCENGWVGAGCQVLPGVTIGSGSITLSNSTVTANVPENSLVGGIPAKVVRSDIRKTLSTEDKLQVLKTMMQKFAAHLQYKGCGVEVNDDIDVMTVSRSDIATRSIVLATREGVPDVPGGDHAIYITLDLKIDAEPGNYVFDLDERQAIGVEDRLVHELRNFLRRQGVRFKPYNWDSSYLKDL